MMASKTKITDFFKKSIKREPEASHQDDVEPARKKTLVGQPQDDSDYTTGSPGCSTLIVPAPALAQLDIANFVEGGARDSDETKFRLIQGRLPHPQFKFPSREFKDKRRESGVMKRYCQHDWFKTYPFVTYSAKEDGLYCLPCVMFPVKPKQGSLSKLLISQPYRNWKDARSDLSVHSTLDYHKAAMATMSGFSQTMTKPEKRVDQILSEKRRLLIEKNRKLLKSVIKSIELCGRQGWALRGHRDDSTSTVLNQGNFKALLNFRVDAGDEALDEHLATAPKNALYTSKTCQNDLLLCMKDYMQQLIVSEVKAQPLRPFYTVEADEVTDVSNWEQLAVVIRYLKGAQPVERLVDYIACDSITGEEICKNILQSLRSLGLDPQDCRGQTYDGAGNMAGKEKGCAARFKEVSPRAPYLHCASHSLNLALSKACSVAEVHCMLCTIKSTGLFFEGSPKRSRELEKAIENVNSQRREDDRNTLPQIPLKKLKLLCETRWVERHSTLEDFSILFEPLLDCLEKIRTRMDQTWSTKAVTEANGLLSSLTTASFIVTYVCATYLFGYTKSLSTMLQGTSMDVIRAYEQISLVSEELKAVRENVDEEFDSLFTTVTNMAESAGIEITVPRNCRRQTLRTNVPSDGSAKCYWKRAVFIPYLHGLIAQLSERFTGLSCQAIRGLFLLPQNLAECTDEKINDIIQYYGPDMPSPASAMQEIRIWKRFWAGKKEGELPKTISETLDQMNRKQFPGVHAVLHILLLLPVTSAEVERVHSAFKLIKTNLRSTMGEDRLNALILLYYHKDLALDYDAIVNMYARRHPRRMTFLNPLQDEEN